MSNDREHIDLFSGIGGAAFAVDAVWPGTKHTFCEIDPFCQAVLKKNFPTSKIYGDIRTLTADAESGRTQGRQVPVRPGRPLKAEADAYRRPFILTGGFPCQPFSNAGRRKGTEDNRHLWPEMLRVIRELGPTWILGENVAGLLSIERGVVFETVCADLENSGYEVQAFVVPAVAIGAPHRRDRVWIVAHRESGKDDERGRGIVAEAAGAGKSGDSPARTRDQFITADPRGERRQQKPGGASRDESPDERRATHHDRIAAGEDQIARTDSDRAGLPQRKQSGKPSHEPAHRAEADDRAERSHPDIGTDAAGDRRIGRGEKATDEKGQRAGSAQSGKLEGRPERPRGNASDTGSEGSQRRELAGTSRKEAGTPRPASEPDRIIADGQSERRGQGGKAGRGYGGNAEALAERQRDRWSENWVAVAADLCRVDDGLPAGMDGLKLSAPSHRRERLKGLGNAWVPQVAIEIMKAMRHADEN